MSFPTETSPQDFPVGWEGGVAEGRVAAALDPSRWFVDYCEICDSNQVFVVGGLGLVACCVTCGDERVSGAPRGL